MTLLPYGVMSLKRRKICPECTRCSHEVMLKCNHINEENESKHKSGTRKRIIDYIYEEMDQGDVNKNENSNVVTTSISPCIHPSMLRELFKSPDYIYNEKKITKDDVHKIIITLDPNGLGKCRYGMSMAYVTKNGNIVVSLFFLFVVVFF